MGMFPVGVTVALKSFPGMYFCKMSSKTAKLSVQCDATGKIKLFSEGKMLGVWGSGGAKRCTKGQKQRLKAVKDRTSRVHALRRAGICTTHLVKASYASAMLYEAQCAGVSDAHLQNVRSAAAQALAPPTRGKNSELILYLTDAGGGTADPAFDAHTLPLLYWAYAWW